MVSELEESYASESIKSIIIRNAHVTKLCTSTVYSPPLCVHTACMHKAAKRLLAPSVARSSPAVEALRPTVASELAPEAPLLVEGEAVGRPALGRSPFAPKKKMVSELEESACMKSIKSIIP